MAFCISARLIKRAGCLFAGLVCSLIAIAPVRADDLSNWRVVQIPGASDVQAQAINLAGQVAGTYVSGDTHHGFIRNSDGSIVTIDVFANYGTVVWDINSTGQTIGTSGNHGFIRNPDGSVITINFPQSSSPTALTGISDSGQTVGGGGGGVTFLRNADGTFTTLHGPNGILPEPFGVNDSGQIVGVYFEAVTGKAHGFVMDTHGSFTTIDVPGAIYTSANGINNLGQIVGDYGVHPTQYPNQEQNRGFIRDTDGTITLFDAPEFGSTMPNGIADNGTIAASFSRTSGNFPPNIGLVRSCILCP